MKYIIPKGKRVWLTKHHSSRPVVETGGVVDWTELRVEKAVVYNEYDVEGEDNASLFFFLPKNDKEYQILAIHKSSVTIEK